MTKKISIFLIAAIVSLSPFLCLAQNEEAFKNEEIIEAEVMEILEEREIAREDGSKNIQQNLKLKGLTGSWENKEFVYEGISEFDAVSLARYKKGDKVLVSHHTDVEGAERFYITDFIRRKWLYALAILFAIAIVVIAGFKGIRAILSLLISFIVIMNFIIPRILAGGEPLFISILGSIAILAVIIYLTEGLNRRSNLAIISILISLGATGVLAIIFTSLSKLSGMAGEEAMFLIGLSKTAINFKGLLLAGIIIGTLGVLDDAVISQLAAVEEIRKADNSLTGKELYKKAFNVGISHISSMTNTLFLAYAGASLPLLLLFSVKQPPFMSFSQIINNELIAMEIVRALVGSIGLVMAVPIATILGVKFGKEKSYRTLVF